MDRYTDIQILKTLKGNRYYSTNLYPTIPLSDTDIYVITDDRDRYDLLANQYYNDTSLWWIIATANPSIPPTSIYPPVGSQIRIPINITSILQEYSNINRF